LALSTRTASTVFAPPLMLLLLLLLLLLLMLLMLLPPPSSPTPGFLPALLVTSPHHALLRMV
jgi:hypothetical protein